jgi:hypothetical protein
MAFSLLHFDKSCSPTSHQSGIKSSFLGPWLVLALAGIWRLVVQIKAIEKHKFVSFRRLVVSCRWRALRVEASLSDTMYSLITFKKSTPTKKCELNISISNGKQ